MRAKTSACCAERSFGHALITPEEFCGERSVAALGHAQRERTHTRGEPTRAVAVAVGTPLVGSLVGLGTDMLSHLGLKHLVEDLLKEQLHPLVMRKNVFQLVGVDSNLHLGHCLSAVFERFLSNPT